MRHMDSEGRRLVAYLDEVGLSQAKFADIAGRTEAAISKWCYTVRFKPGQWDNVVAAMEKAGLDVGRVRLGPATKTHDTHIQRVTDLRPLLASLDLKAQEVILKVLEAPTSAREALRLVLDERLRRAPPAKDK